GARFVHDRLELHGWQVEIADAQKVKGLAPLACKTDRVDAWVLAELAQRDLVPAIWLPDPRVRASQRLIDELDREIGKGERERRQPGADYRYVRLLCNRAWNQLGSPTRSPPTRSPPSPATSTASPRRASSPATAVSAGGCISQGSATCAAHSASRARGISAGRSSKQPSTPAPTRSTATATSKRRRGSAKGAAPR